MAVTLLCGLAVNRSSGYSCEASANHNARSERVMCSVLWHPLGPLVLTTVCKQSKSSNIVCVCLCLPAPSPPNQASSAACPSTLLSLTSLQLAATAGASAFLMAAHGSSCCGYRDTPEASHRQAIRQGVLGSYGTPYRHGIEWVTRSTQAACADCLKNAVCSCNIKTLIAPNCR